MQDVSFEVFRRLVGTPRKYSVEFLEATLHDWDASASAERLGLTTESFKAWRELVLRDRWTRGIPRGVPDVGAFASHWGTFLDALVAVGLISSDEALRRRLELGDRLPSEEVAALVRSAHRQDGGAVDRATWHEFRSARMRDTGRSVPSEETVINKLGAADFDDAVAIAIRMGPESAPRELAP